jgi:hypothetical protein
MERRRKAVYIEYDYEAAYQKALTDMEEDNMERMLKEGRVRSLYATKEIRAGEQMDVEIYPEFRKNEREQIPDEAKKARQRKAQRNLNEKNSRKECERTINANFGNDDIWGTLTYTDDNMPNSMKEAQHDMTLYIGRLNYERKKMGLAKLRYVYVTECSDKGRWHHHFVCDGDMGLEAVEEKWKKGRRNQVRRLQKDEHGLSGMANYITKQKHPEKKGKEPKPVEKYQKAWKASKGLKKPEVKKNHYKFKQKDVDEIVTGRCDLEDKLKKWYAADGYKLTSYEVRYNNMNGRFYIYAKMYKPEEGGQKKSGKQKNKAKPKTKKKTQTKKTADQCSS